MVNLTVCFVLIRSPIWRFPKIGVLQNGWFIIENPFKIDDLGVPPFQETSNIYKPLALTKIWEDGRDGEDEIIEAVEETWGFCGW